MKIGLVLPQTPLYSETFFQSEIVMLQDAEFDVELFVWKANKAYNHNVKVNQELTYSSNKTVARLKMICYLLIAFFTYPKKLIKYKKLLQENQVSNIDILKRVFANHHILKAKNLDCLHFGYLNMTQNKELLAKVLDTKMIVSFRGADIGVEPILSNGMYDKVWQHVDKIHTASNGLLEKAYQFGLPKNIPVEKITPSLAEHFVYSPKVSFEFKHGKPIQILTISRLHWKKSLEYTLKALSILKKKNIPFEYIVLGDGAERERLLYEIHDLDLTNEVQLMGKVSHQEVKNYLERAEICINYSIQEGFCIGALEAQAMGKLCIVSDAEGLPENVEHKKSGWVLPRREPELLAAKIEEIYKMEEDELLQVSRYAIQRVKTTFNRKKHQQELIEFYTSAIKE